MKILVKKCIKVFNLEGEESATTDINADNIIIEPEIVVPRAEHGTKFYSGDIVKHTYLYAAGSEVGDREEVFLFD